MSDAVTALGSASSDEGIATIREALPQGMITLRGDVASPAIAKAVQAATGGGVPDMRGCSVDAQTGVAWMSPDELLVLAPYANVPDTLAKMQKALGKAHALAVNVSDARAMFHVEGPMAGDVLAKLCPVDTSVAALPAGMIRRTRMAQVPAAIWRSDETAFTVICFRSQARYVFDLLSVAAQEGSEI